jgi:hypothetical protein
VLCEKFIDAKNIGHRVATCVSGHGGPL